jgi:hypothetical protein
MRLNKIFALINVLLCVIITLLNQRQNTVWVLCAVYIFVCFFAFTFINKEPILKNKFFLKISILYVIFFIAIVSNNLPVNWGKYISLAFIPIVIFQTNFYLLKKKYLSINLLIITTVIIALIASYKVFFVSRTINDFVGSSFQTNWSNLLGACLPIVFLIKKRKIQYLFLIFVGTFIIIGLKRTGMISFFITLFVFIFFRVKNNKGLFSLKWALVTLLFLSLSYGYFFKGVNSTSLDKAMGRIERLSEDGGSGRDNLYSTGFLRWIDNNTIPIESKIIGSGYYGFNRKSGFLNIESSHNDVLDFSYDYGIFAAIFLIFYYVRLIKFLIISWKKRSKYFQFILTTVMVFFVYSFFSAFYHYFFFFIPLILNLALIEVLHLKSSKKVILV